VVVEDLHWADDASEEAFRVCADVVASSRVLMILTFRPGYLHPSADLPNAHRIVLADLDDDARTRLASATLHAAKLSADLAGPVTIKAEGNPLFIEEVAKALAAGASDASTVPDSLQDVILARIDRLEVHAREALQLASVIGREFTLRLLNRISDLHAELEGVLMELKALELIYEKTFFPELAYMFKHALTHDVAYSTLLGERRKTLHRVVAAAIEELYDERIAEHYETLAYHYTQAEDWEKALDYLEKAGDKASAAFANAQAADFYAAAIDACKMLGPHTREREAAIWEKKGFICFTVGNIPEVIDSFDNVIAAARDLADQPRESRGLALRGMGELIGHEFDRSEPTLRAAIALAGDEQHLLYLPTLMLGMQLLITDRHDEARAFMTAAERLAYSVNDPVATGFWDEIAVLLPEWEGRYDEALRYAREGRLGTDEDEITDQFSAMVNLGASWAESLALCAQGRYEEAIAKLRRGLARAERIGDVFYRLRALNSLGWVYIELGDLDKGWEWNSRALEVADELGMLDPEIDSNAELNLGDILVAQGRLDEAEEHFQRVEKIFRDPKPAETWMLWRYGQHMLHSYGELLLKRGDVSRAESFARECIEMATRSNALKNIVKGRRLLGQALAAEGKPDEAERELRAALAVAREIANPPQLWKTLDALGDVLSAGGRHDEASAVREEAVGVIDGVAASLSDDATRATFLGSAAVVAVRAKR
jgi:tetratricopeptide (TPR) repeat protein